MEYVRSADDTEIAFERSGSGPALVLVSGALQVGTPANPLGPLLEPHCTLVRYDRRGRGASGDAAAYAPEREFEDLAAVVGAVKADFVFGHSSGAWIALEAAMRGLPIAKLAVNEPPYMIEGTRPIPPPSMPAELRAMLAAGDREGAVERFVRDQVGLPEQAIEQIRRSSAWSSWLAIAGSVAYDSELTIDSAMPVERLRRLELPVLVIRGDASFPWICVTAERLAATLPHAELVTLEGQPHAKSPAAIGPHLIRFFLG